MMPHFYAMGFIAVQKVCVYAATKVLGRRSSLGAPAAKCQVGEHQEEGLFSGGTTGSVFACSKKVCTDEAILGRL